MTNKYNITFESILANESVITFFQPIVSVRKQSIIGFEALSRGIGSDGNLIPPDILFKMATSNESRLRLDRICRKKAVEAFNTYRNEHSGYMLSVNIDSSIIKSAEKSDHLLHCVENYSIPPSDIIIEILESEIQDMKILIEFVERYRRYGFIIAIDDIGTGFSNQERVIALKPDILKVDRSLINNINNNFFKQEAVKSLISMGHKTGSLIIAEGIETESEAIISMELGADLLQGYYFQKPGVPQKVPDNNLNETIDSTALRFKDHMLKSMEYKREKYSNYDKIISDFSDLLSEQNFHELGQCIESYVNQHPVIECAYIINDEGIQTSNTYLHQDISSKKNKLFQPDQCLTNQSYKDYFLYLKSGLSKFISDPYISTASGNLCITISLTFTCKAGTPLILCVDIREE